MTRTRTTTNPMLTGRNASIWSMKEKQEIRKTHLVEMATLRRQVQTQRSMRLKHLLTEKDKLGLGSALKIPETSNGSGKDTPKTSNESGKDTPETLGGITNVEILEGVSTRKRGVSNVNKMIEHFEKEFTVASNDGTGEDDIMKIENPMLLAKKNALERKKTAEEWGL